MQRPLLLYILCFLHLFLGVSASVGGAMLFIKPDGSLLGMQKDWLEHSLFKNYFIPGLILFLFVGIFSLLILISLWMKPKWPQLNKLNIYSKMHWSWTYSLYSGLVVIIRILFQQLMTQYFWIQPVIITVGLLIIILTMMPQLIKHFDQQQ